MTILSCLLNPGSVRRSTLANPDDWLVDSLVGGSRSLTGEVISPNTALTISAYYAAIRAISEDVAKLPWHVFERTGPRESKRIFRHPLERLIDLEANPEMSALAFRETMTSHALGWGNGFAEIVRRGGVPVALWPLPPDSVRLERNRDTRGLEYVVNTQDRVQVRLKPQNVFHLHGLGFDGLTGYSVAKLAKESLGLAAAQERSGSALFGNSSRPSGILETPEALEPEAKIKLRDAWERMFRGVDNSGRTALLEAGTKFLPLQISNRDAQWLASRNFSVVEIARWFRIPPHKLQDLMRATFSNISEQSIEYVVDTLLSWIKRWEIEVERKLIPIVDQPLIFSKHIVEGLLRGDFETRVNGYQKAIQTGWMSRNEARALENLNPEEGLGDFLVPLNLGEVGDDGEPTNNGAQAARGERRVPGEPGEEGPVGSTGPLGATGKPGVDGLAGKHGKDGPKGAKGDQGEPGAPADSRIDAAKVERLIVAHLPAFVEAYQQLLRVEIDKVQRAGKRQDVKAWAEKFYADHGQQVRGVLRAPIEAFCGSMRLFAVNDVVPDTWAQDVATRTVDIVERHIERSLEDLHDPRSVTLDTILDTWRNGRAESVATEELRNLATMTLGMMDKTL